MKITVGDLCDKLDILSSLENKLRDGMTLEEIVDMLSENGEINR